MDKNVTFTQPNERVVVPLYSAKASDAQKLDCEESAASAGFPKPIIHVDGGKFDQTIFISNWYGENGLAFKDGFEPSRIVSIDGDCAVLSSGPDASQLAIYRRVLNADGGLLAMLGRLVGWDAMYARVK